MLPFELLFEEVARRESRRFQLRGPDGRPSGTFLFRELYCVEPGCDCRAVLIHVVRADGAASVPADPEGWSGDVAASFSYSLEPSRGKPKPTLEPFDPQSDLSPTLLRVFAQTLSDDPGYRPALLRHHEAWRRAVDHPSPAERAKLEGRVPNGPPVAPRARRATRKAARPPATKPVQCTLPLDTSPEAARAPGPTSGLERVGAGAAWSVEGKLQRRFRKLSEKVDRLKLRVTAWRAGRPDFLSEAEALEAALRRRDALARRVVLLLDGAFAQLSKADRRFVGPLVVEIAGDLLRGGAVEGEDQELSRAYERHRKRAFAADQARDAAEMRSLLDAIGVELGDDLDLTSPETLLESVRQKLEAEQEERAREGSPRRRRSAKQVAAEERRAAEERDVHKAVQDVYREIVRSIHPDREQDPLERDRKTALLREVNAAYEARDLLPLLELQLRLARLDGRGSGEALPEARLAQYVRVLEEQARQLGVELEEMELPFRLRLDLAPPAAIDPPMVLARLREDRRDVEAAVAELSDDVADLEDPTRRATWLKRERAARRRDDIPF